MGASIEKPIVFFDGVCSLCNTFVDFLFRKDKRKTFLVASLQGKTAQSLSIQGMSREGEYLSVVLKDEQGIHRGSTAIFRILARLGGVWTVVSWLKIIPVPIRNTVYYFIAKNRYKWFGKRDTCRVPTPFERARFLE